MSSSDTGSGVRVVDGEHPRDGGELVGEYPVDASGDLGLLRLNLEAMARRMLNDEAEPGDATCA